MSTLILVYLGLTHPAVLLVSVGLTFVGIGAILYCETREGK